MLMSKLIGERLKEKPSDANFASHVFLIRGGYVRQVANGIYSMLLPAKKVAMKIEGIIREEMNRIDGQEVLMPVVLPAELWRESGRFESVGSELMRMKDRAGHDMLLGMTHEEAAVHLVRNEAVSYTKYPFMIYQIQTKFRDEPRSRGGLIRVREFTMKDAYSFHTSQEDLQVYYDKVYEAYHTIFERVGIPQVISVKSDTGMMGGSVAHEYMLLTDVGEDSIVLCDKCGYKANMEVAVSKISKSDDEEQALQEVYTPDISSIEALAEFLGVESNKLMKAIVFSVENSSKPLVVFVRGDVQVNEAKLKRVIRANVYPWTEYNADLCFGFIGAIGLNPDKVDILYDASLKGETNLITGANKTDYHIKGLSIERDLKVTNFVDVAKANEGDECVNCGEKLTIQRGIEVGNIFQLGTKYTQSMNMTYVDKDETRKNPIMGCYGIGVGRLLACLIEANHDDFGPIWPKAVAPWQVHICMLNSSNENIRKTGFELYEKLQSKYDVILDDRDVNAGGQFADADLLGVPVRIVVSKRNIDKGELEISTRDKSVKMNINIEEAEQRVAEILENL